MDVSATGLLRSKKPPYLWEVCILRTWDTWTGDALLLDERLAVTRLPAPKPEPSDFSPEGKPLKLDPLLPQQVGQTKELWVRVGDEHRHLMRLLILRVPEDVAERRRADLEADAKRRGQPVRERAWTLADWTILLTDVPANPPSLAGGPCPSAGTVANGDALQVVEAIWAY
jgi:hypothetical protein